MTYQTLLVHLNDVRRAERLLRPAIALAARGTAHLIGLHVVPHVIPPTLLGVQIGAETTSAIKEQLADDGEAIRQLFLRMTAEANLDARWDSITAPTGDLAEAVMTRGRAADLIVASQADPHWTLAPIHDFPERLAIESGRPVLIIPNAPAGGRTGSAATPATPTGLGRTIVVAWNGSRACARAAFDALPLLVDAERVHVLSVSNPSGDPDNQAALLPNTAIAECLARHGVRVRTSETRAIGGDVAATILATCHDVEADLVVLGAYGHSRLHEFVFGGVTRHLMRHGHLPMLFSH